MGHNLHSYLIADDPTLATAEMNDVWEDEFLDTANLSLRDNINAELPASNGSMTGIYTADKIHPSYLHISLPNYTPDLIDKLPGSNGNLSFVTTPWATPWECKGTPRFLEEIYYCQRFYGNPDHDAEHASPSSMTKSPSSSSTQSTSTMSLIPMTSTPPTLRTPTSTPTSTPTTPTRQKRTRRSSTVKTSPTRIVFVHDERSMPVNFQENPNNHARFIYHDDGTREYLNAPRKRRKTSSSTYSST